MFFKKGKDEKMKESKERKRENEERKKHLIGEEARR